MIRPCMFRKTVEIKYSMIHWAFTLRRLFCPKKLFLFIVSYEKHNAVISGLTHTITNHYLGTCTATTACLKAEALLKKGSHFYQYSAVVLPSPQFISMPLRLNIFLWLADLKQFQTTFLVFPFNNKKKLHRFLGEVRL